MQRQLSAFFAALAAAAVVNQGGCGSEEMQMQMEMPPPPPAECSAQNPTGKCPPGEMCSAGACEVIPCSDRGLEPNDTRDKATAAPDGETKELEICEGDTDWYKLAVPPGHIGTVGVTFRNSDGDLEL